MSLSIAKSSSRPNSSSSETSSSSDKSSSSSKLNSSSIDKSSSSSKLNSSARDNSSAALSFVALAGSFLVSNSLKKTSSEACFLRLNNNANNESISAAGIVPITILNHKLEVILCSASSACCFSSNSSFSRASALAKSACCNVIISFICNFISLAFATSSCITLSLSLKTLRR